MAIQFPPISAGDPLPVDGDTYIYAVTGEEFVYNVVDNSWSSLGASSLTIGFQGPIEVQKPAPYAESGWVYSVVDGGTRDVVDPSFNGLAGVVDVEAGNLIIYNGTDWQVILSAAGPWIRTIDGKIEPLNDGDDLDMLSGSYQIESLDPLF